MSTTTDSGAGIFKILRSARSIGGGGRPIQHAVRDFIFVQRVAEIHQINPGVRVKVVSFRAPDGAQIGGKYEQLVGEMPEPSVSVLQREAFPDRLAVRHAMHAHVLPIAGGRRVVRERDGSAYLFYGYAARKIPHGMARRGKDFERRVEIRPVAFPRHFDLTGRLDGNALEQRRNRAFPLSVERELRFGMNFPILRDYGDGIAKLRLVRSVFVGEIVERGN